MDGTIANVELQLDLILPGEIYELIRHQLDGDVGTVHYARVYMSLKEILAGDFFNEYIKKGMQL